MAYAKAQLEARVQALAACLASFDVVYFEQVVHKPEWATRYRENLYNGLVAARKALAEVEEKEEASPYAPSEAYLKALRSFGFTDEDCVAELRSARESDFELLLADEVRKAYDQGKADGQVIGFAKGYDEGYDEGFDAADGRTKASPELS